MNSIFEYLDYRTFIKDFYEERKKKNPHFSHRYIAQKMGFDPGYFSKIVSGQRNISVKLILKFANFIGLNSEETNWFENLVLFNQSKTHSEKSRFYEKLKQHKNCKFSLINSNQYAIFEEWYYVSIREILSFYPCKADNIEGLAKLVLPQISVKQAKNALRVLEGAGLVKKNPQGIFKRVEPVWSTGDAATSTILDNFHLQSLDLAKEAFDRFPRDHRNMSTLTLSVSADSYKTIEVEIAAFRKRLLNIARDTPAPDRVYHCSINMFPMSSSGKKAHNE